MPVPDVPPSASGTSHARYLVVIDASHGGAERGAALSQELAEKDVTLAFARRLRNELRERGVATLMMRDADLTIPLEHRAETVNVAHAAVYISIHASTPGPGVRLYTSMLRPAERRSGFIPWEEAQAPHVAGSRQLAAAVSAALEKSRIDVGYMPAPVRPLNSVAAAAIAVELSPPRADAESILNSNFQASLASTVASAVLNARAEVEAAR
jgi:N-acetylmuramoyl-L-alanine amidase